MCSSIAKRLSDGKRIRLDTGHLVRLPSQHPTRFIVLQLIAHSYNMYFKLPP